METERECFLASFVVVLIPCATRTVVILELVGRFVGFHAALALGLIMEMPPYKRPSVKSILIKTWNRTKDFVYIAFPIIIGGSVVIEALNVFGFTYSIVDAMSPLTTGWLGLPVVVVIPLIFGILRKELTLIMLSTLLPLQSLSAIQMIVFSLVTMIYIPCIVTIAACTREFGWKKALATTLIDIALALLLGGIAYRVLSVFL